MGIICKDMKNIFVIQGDSLQRRYTFYDKDKNMITNQYLNSVLFSCKRLNYEQFLVYDDGAWVLTLTSEITSNFNQCRTSYDITLYFESEQVSTQVYRAEFNVLKKDMIQDVEVSGEGESVDLDDIDVVVDTNVNIIVSGSKNHDELEHRDYENQHPMSAITGLEDTLQELNNDKQNKINEYLKSASVSGNTLNLTKQDDSTISFTPRSGGGGEKSWQLIKSAVVPADPSSDTSGVTWVTNENGIYRFVIDSNNDGNPFSYKKIRLIVKIPNKDAGGCCTGNFRPLLGINIPAPTGNEGWVFLPYNGNQNWASVIVEIRVEDDGFVKTELDGSTNAVFSPMPGYYLDYASKHFENRSLPSKFESNPPSTINNVVFDCGTVVYKSGTIIELYAEV